jgi:predicted PurR-regulated permease PerM
MDFKKIQTFVFFLLLASVGYLFVLMLWPYVMGLFWAAVIAAIFYPVYEWIFKRVKQKNTSALLTMLLVVVIVALPLSIVGSITVQQTVGLTEQLRDPATIEQAREYADTLLENDLVEGAIGEGDVETRIEEITQIASDKALEWVQAGSGNVLMLLVNLLVMLYALYYMFKDGPRWLERLMHLVPLGDENEKVLFEKFVSTSKATLKGTILLGGMQGVMGGLLFWALGVPSAAFWGLVMVVLSIIPAVGAPLIWGPTAAYLLVSGSVWQGVVMIVVGILISLSDNLLRPPLVGRDIQMHPIVILLSTIGGLALFGISGVVIGPMVAAFFLAFLQMYEAKYKRQLDSSAT